jgi:hypothetical protein
MSCDQIKRIGVVTFLSPLTAVYTESYRCIVRELKHDSYDAENEPAQKLRNSIKFQISTDARSRLSLSLVGARRLSIDGSTMGIKRTGGAPFFICSKSITRQGHSIYCARALGTK